MPRHRHHLHTEIRTMGRDMSMYAVVDPATGDVVQEYPTATDEQMEQALSAAVKAHREWGRTSTLAERAALMKQVARLHTERREELAKIIQREMGKPLDQALGEVNFSAAIYEYYADNAEKFLADEPIDLLGGRGPRPGPSQARSACLIGNVPSNYPYYQGARVRGPRSHARQHRRSQRRGRSAPSRPPRFGQDLHRHRVPRRRVREPLRHQRPGGDDHR